MHQVQNLLFQNHRRSLAYPNNHVQLEPRQSYKEVFPSPRRKFMANDLYQHQHKSVDLNKKNVKKELENSHHKKKVGLLNKLSKAQEELVQKYFSNFVPKNKQPVFFKNMYNHKQSRGLVTTRGDQSHATNSIFPPIAETSSRISDEDQSQSAKQQQVTRYLEITALAQKLPTSISKLINGYYVKTGVLQEPLFCYSEIIKYGIAEQQYDFISDALQNLFVLSKSLKDTSVRGDILRFITLITLQRVYMPNDFLTQFQLQRLNICQNELKIEQITNEQIKMIVGIYLGIKLFCMQIITKPWSIEYLKLNKQTINSKGYKVIKFYYSYISTIIMKFYKNLPILSYNCVNRLAEKGVTPYKIPRSSQRIYDQIQVKYEKQHTRIVNNLYTWVSKIGDKVIKNRKIIRYKENQLQSI